MLVEKNTINYFSVYKNIKTQDTSYTVQDTIPVSKKDTNSSLKDTSFHVNRNFLEQLDLSKADSILKQSENRERQIKTDTVVKPLPKQTVYRRKIDTTELLYKQFGIANFPIKNNILKDPFNQNVLYNLQSVNSEKKANKQTVFVESSNNKTAKNYSYTAKQIDKIQPKYISNKIQIDWVTILLIASFLLIGWVRLFYKKYLVSVIKSIILYKEAYTLYKEKNSMMEKASFLMNLLYVTNISVFCLQLKHFYNLSLEGLEDYLFYLIVFASFVGFNIFRVISASFIGYIFLKQKIFAEYIHNVNIFTKNIGIFLFPIIIAIQFLPYNDLKFITYLGIIIIVLIFLLQLIRSFQIINHKNLSIFFMILYLCAFEFAPFLVIYKMLLSHL